MAKNEGEKTAAQDGPKIKWDTSKLKSSYCNVCNATSTREEVVLNFGINESWDRGHKEMEVEVAHRIILSPFAAKRLLGMVSTLLEDYETRYGELK